jgi:DNA-binding response OmpR family regulator
VRVLIVEDDPKLAELMVRALKEQGLAAESAADGEAGLAAALDPAVDAVILDLMLPKLGGLEVLAEVRKTRPDLPVMILTALAGPEHAARGLDRGADDYLAKPFALPEFLARTRALLRRAGSRLTSSVERVGDLEVDLAARVVKRAGRVLALTPREYSLLVFFFARRGRAVSRAEIGEHVIDREFTAQSNAIDVSVSGLRAKLGEPQLIRTVRGVGYRLAAPEEP